MYANWVTFNVGAGKRQQMEELGKQFRPALEQAPGFESLVFLGNDETGEYGSLITWATKEDAENAFQATFPKLQEAIKDQVKGPPTRVLFEVMSR